MPQSTPSPDRFAVILAGGRGERFWPMSTRAHPKQFLTLFGGKSLIAWAVERLKGLVAPENIFVITSADLTAPTAEAAPVIPAENIVGEPCGRDTAPAVALACALVRRRNPQAVVAILTADQLMTDVKAFRETLADCYTVAATADAIITIGIKPTYPATGFGYIEMAAPLVRQDVTVPFFHAARFVEKPDEETACSYLESGNYAWNAGMFIWQVSTMLAAFRNHAPDFAAFVENATEAEDLMAFMAETYSSVRRISIDYAVMEHASNIIVAGGDFGWDDVGTWPSLESHFPSDTQDNVVIGADAHALEARGNIVVSDDPTRFTALFGVDDLIVVHAGRATLVCPKDRAQELKKLVIQLDARPDCQDLL